MKKVRLGLLESRIVKVQQLVAEGGVKLNLSQCALDDSTPPSPADLHVFSEDNSSLSVVKKESWKKKGRMKHEAMKSAANDDRFPWGSKNQPASLFNEFAQAVFIRRSKQEAQLQARLADGGKADAISRRNIMIVEETKEMLRQLRSLKPAGDHVITTIEVPTDGNFETNRCKECTDWTTIDEPKNIKAALLKRNRIHFGEGQDTPPTI
ncbi:hypothetical protein IV203_013609 [Nitzschia inconspicua]|uniref:Uncharacterized protein n=1 Tax=Nitzschia inconspicua TaxID=303405 RepID=A0A9K3M5X4_9STRA|nr:hypothetical protein IV203_013609 [Nitzschia inconspicua]